MEKRTEVVAFDRDGKRVEPGSPEAHTGEAVDYDTDGNVVRRSYLVNAPMPTVVDDLIDAALAAEPGEWNLAVEDDDGVRPVDNLETLIEFLGGDRIGPDRIRRDLMMLLLLPSYANAPEQLKTQVYAYLAG